MPFAFTRASLLRPLRRPRLPLDHPSTTIVFTEMGHRIGVMAPGIRDLGIYAKTVHHALLAHGKAVQVFRAGGYKGEIGITHANTSYEPADDTRETAQAVELARDFDTRLFHGPVFGKGYPASVVRNFESRDAPFPVFPGDMETIAAPTDFLGTNLYSRGLIEADPGRGVGYRRAMPRLPLLPMGYEAAPHSLVDLSRFVPRRSTATQNLHHRERRLRQHRTRPPRHHRRPLRIELLTASSPPPRRHPGRRDSRVFTSVAQGQLQWAFGNSKRFGIVHTDFQTLKRTPKRSAGFYADVIRRNGLEA